MFAPYPMGPLTPPLTLALIILMGMPSRPRCRAPPPFWTTSSCLFTAPGSIQELYSVITNAPIRQASEEKDPVGKVTRD
jgi:hypothetical protein